MVLQIANLSGKSVAIANSFSDMQVDMVQTRQSLVIRKHLKVVDVAGGFEDQKAEVQQALEKAQELVLLATEIEARLDSLITI